MPTTIVVAPDASLPLTCTRAGTCCHGKDVPVNPWELACLARAAGMDVTTLIARRTAPGGVRLRFDGPPGWRGHRACAFYDPTRGCSAHAGRPLACRLYPLGRERRGQTVRYTYDGPAFPCLAGCPDVEQLPAQRVDAYLAGQAVAEGEAVSDAYLEVVQDLAEGAFVIVVDTGLAASGTPGVLAAWRAAAATGDHERLAGVPPELATALLSPGIDPVDGRAFVGAHAQVLQERAQAAFAALRDAPALVAGSAAMLRLALHLARGLGADTAALADRWLATAQAEGWR